MQQTAPAGLYEEDYALWIAQQVAALREYARQGTLRHLDVENVIEELEGLARRDRLSLFSHVTVVMVHLLKLLAQPPMATRSWLASINASATKAKRLIVQSPSMANLLNGYLVEAYPDARRQASIETGIDVSEFPTALTAEFRDVLKAAMTNEDYGGEAIVRENERRRGDPH